MICLSILKRAQKAGQVAPKCLTGTPLQTDRPMSWTEEMVEKMIKLRDEGLSSSQIGAQLGVSRNAVIGKVHRLGLHVPRAEQRPGSMARPTSNDHRNRNRKLVLTPPKIIQMRRLAEKMRAADPAAFLPTVPPSEPGVPGVSILDLTPKHCRWPLGDPRDPDFRYCGDDHVSGRPYCIKHCCEAYQGLSQFRPTRPSRMRRAA